MNIAILSDIHGNSEALKAVLQEAKNKKAKKLLILGDLIGYYYNIEEIIQQLNSWEKIIIQGNHERMLKKAMLDKQYLKFITEKYGHGIELAINVLSKEDVNSLIQLPVFKKISINKKQYLLSHGAPWDTDEYIYPDAQKNILDKALSYTKNYVLLGHTHYPFIYKNNGKVLVNPGSVGQPRKKGGVAQWAIIDTLSDNVSLQETEYDIQPVLEQVKKFDPEIEYLSAVLNR